MLSRDALAEARAAGIRPGDWYRPLHASVWEAMSALSARGDPVDTVTVAAEVEGLPLDTLMRWQIDTPSSAAVAAYARRVVGLAARRAVIAAGAEVAEAGWTLDADAAQEAAAAAVAAAARPTAGGPRLLADVADDLLAAWASGGRAAVGCGIDAVDRVVRMRPGELHIVGARTAVGKSSYLLAAAAHAARHHGPVLVFSLEMSAAEVAARMLAHHARVSVTADTPPADRDHEAWQAIMRRALPAAAEMPVWIDDSPNMTAARITATAQLHAARHRPAALLVVDYAQLVSGGAGDTRQEEVAAVTRGLKAAARTLDCPVMAASQLRRPGADTAQRRPQLSDLRESGAIEQDADSVLLLHRPESSQRRMSDRPDVAEPADLDVIVAKNRHGPAGTTISCRWYPAWALIAAASATTPQQPQGWLPYRD